MLKRARQPFDRMDPYPTNPLTGGVPDTTYRADPYGGPAYDPPTRASPRSNDRVDYTRWAFYAGLAGGVLILLAAFVVALFLTAWATFGGGTLPGWGAWNDAADVERGESGFPEIPILLSIWGLVTGGAVLLAALRAREYPDRAALPGIVMVAGGLLSFFALGGFLIGGLLAMIGGVLAIAGSRTLWTARGPRVRDRDYARPGP